MNNTNNTEKKIEVRKLKVQTNIKAAQSKSRYGSTAG